MHRLKRAGSRASSATSAFASTLEVDVSALPATFHLGFSVPTILATLRNQLDFTDGLKEEGIFRICGKETEIALLYQDLNNGVGMSNPNSHNAATLMKRWFSSWTNGKLFHGIPHEAFTNYKSLDLCNYLTEPRLSIWKWLLQLLVDTYAFREYNKMTAENIAIVWAPALLNGIDSVRPDKIHSILAVTRYATEYLEYLIINDGKSLPSITKVVPDVKEKANNQTIGVPPSPTKQSAPIHPLFSNNNNQFDQKYPSLFTNNSRPHLGSSRENNVYKSSPAILFTPPPPPPITKITHEVRKLRDLAKSAAIPSPICPPPSLTIPNNV